MSGGEAAREAVAAASRFYEEKLPVVRDLLRSIEGRIVDDDVAATHADILTNEISRIIHFELGPWFQKPSRRELHDQIVAMADALEAWRAATHGLGQVARSFVWPWPPDVPFAEDGEKWKIGNDELAHALLHDLPPRLPSVISQLRRKADEIDILQEKVFRPRGRPRKEFAIEIAREAARTWASVTGKIPRVSNSTNSDGGPFARFVLRLFQVAEIDRTATDYRTYALKAASPLRRLNGRKTG